MRKTYLTLTCTLMLFCITVSGFAQSTAWNNPDSAKNVSKPGNPWNITNPIGSNHDTMLHTPYNAAFSDSTDFLYMYDFGFNVPATATIEGIEMILARGACNGGSHFEDTVGLAYNNAPMGITVTDSAGPSSEIDTLGSPIDLWYNVLTPAMVNSRSFGVYYSSRAVGICTFGLFDCKLKVHYSMPTGINGVATSKAISVYPNPATTELVLNAGNIAMGTAYTVTDAMGRVVGRGVISDTETKVNVENLTAGIYILRLQDAVTRFMKK